ncbi:putative Receptor-like protein kinase 1 [Hibiscus syriacus]|uniref:Receptor-like serine/threonine-protein kinase n=1 Tax=Hibiscus syriacus TaxID=106335 RepID=A0A6A2WQV0_HIBSY|nr:putative Receptor-like protein kinase 1 [Hibiscus syriacus]
MALVFFPLISLLLLLLVRTDAQTVGNLTVGASLSADENSHPWISPSGDYAFGFHQLSSDKSLFLLAIWYNKIPDRTLVWYANGDSPAPKGSKLQLTADREFVLSNPQGEQLWNSEVSNGAVDSGVMDDNGSFKLLGSGSVLWESFKYPADTVLPSQTLDEGLFLSSRQSETNFSKGRFRLVLRSDDSLVLATVNLPSDHVNDPYHKSGTAGDSNSSSPASQLVFNESGYLFVLRENEERDLLTQRTTGSAKNVYYRATLGFDGVFTLYSHPKTFTGNNARWTALWSEPDNICTSTPINAGSGACGLNNICSITAEKRPSCGCPSGYTLVDPMNRYGNCKPNFTQSCDQEPAPVEDLYDFEVLINVDWPLADYALLEPFTEDQCRQSCLNDCMCAVAIFRLGDKCWKKKLPLSNGRFDPTLNGGKALIKVRKGGRPPLAPYFPNQELKNKDKNQEPLILIISTSRSEPVVETNLRSFTYKELVDATDEFREELGRGAFGIVYRGTLPMSYISQVAVKRLNTLVHGHAEKEFKTEVNVIGQTHHKNLVRLLGFCDEGENRLLVYEYLSNGTLASFLFGGLRPSWIQRTQIAFGIARGLLYLHEECSTQIIHCDIKPQNILLDEYYNARISDFDMESSSEERAILTDWAYDCYLEETLDLLVENDVDAQHDLAKVERFVQVAIWCIQEDLSLRPTMREVTQMLEGVVQVPAPPCPCPYASTA